jgi:hypothetical protein
MDDSVAAAAFAERLGYSFEDLDEGEIGDLPLTFLHSGMADTIEDVVSGDWEGMPFSAFVYTAARTGFGSQYPFGSAPSKWHEATSRCVLTRIEADLPDTVISRETVGHWFTHLITHDRVDVEDESLSRHIRVTSVDPDGVRPTLDDTLRTWLLDVRYRVYRNLCFEFSGAHVMLFTRWLPAETIPKLLPLLKEFSELLARSAPVS